MPASPEAYWKTAAIARLIAQARAGDAWQAIGLGFYPHSRNAQRAGKAAAEIFRRHASDDDRAARAAAIRQRNYNKNPGLSPRAERRRRQHRRDDVPVLCERIDPWAGLGSVFG